MRRHGGRRHGAIAEGRMKGWAWAAAAVLLAAPLARAADPPPAAPGVRYLYLVRHGDYDRDDRADDRVGNGLNPRGREQARLVGERLARLPVKMSSLVSSDYTRARETADIIGRSLGMTPVRDSLIHECTPASDRAPARGDMQTEDFADCDSTLAAAWAKYVRPAPGADAHDVLVCHGNVIRWLVSRALGADTRRWRHLDIANGSLSVIAVRPDGSTRLVMFSDVGHLPVGEQTWTGSGAGWGSPAPR
jgi:serine/threonine-protein phosphatase PGAM5